MINRLRVWLAAALLIAVSSASAFAQGGSGTTIITGTVADASGAILPGASVVAKNNATAEELTSENAALRRELERVRQQRDILKKTLGILSEPPSNASSGSTR